MVAVSRAGLGLILLALLGARAVHADCTAADNLVAPHQRTTWVQGGVVYDLNTNQLKTCDGTNYSVVGGSAAADTISSGTTAVTANSTGYISFTTSGVVTGYLNSAGLLVAPGISITTASGVVSTFGSFTTSSSTASVGVFNKGSGDGLYSYSLNGTGVSGETGSANRSAIYGYNSLGNAIYGLSGAANGNGVYGYSSGGNGIYGESVSGAGVSARSITGPAIYGSGIAGGVYGTTVTGTGVYGITGTGWGVFAGAANGGIALYVSGTSNLNGRVGIGVNPQSAMLEVSGGSLGTTAGSTVSVTRVYLKNSNSSYLDTIGLRVADGTSWNSAAMRLQHIIDASYMGYIQFNGPNQPGGMSFGYGNVTAPTEAMRILSSGKVGIGNITPTVALEVNGTVSATKFVGDGSGLTGISGGTADNIASSTTKVTANSTGYISFTTNGVVTGYFNSSGGLILPSISATAYQTSVRNLYSADNIGIGITAPLATLHLENSSTGGGAPSLLLRNSSGVTPGSFGPQIVLSNTVAGVHGYTINQYQSAASSFAIANTSSPWTKYLVIDQAGDVGIGVSSENPATKLDVLVSGTVKALDGLRLADGVHELRILPGTGGSGAYNNLVSAGDNIITYNAGSVGTGYLDIVPWSNTTGGIRMDASGNVGIGTTPSAAIHISSTGTLMRMEEGNTYWAGPIIQNKYGNASRDAAVTYDTQNENGYAVANMFNYLAASGAVDTAFNVTPAGSRTADRRIEAMRILGNGNVGIGTTIPNANLEVNGTVSATSYTMNGVPVREVLGANRTYYVATTGNDSSTCLTAGSPCLTVQGALNKAGSVDFNTHTVTIQIADGTYTTPFSVGAMVGQGDETDLVIQGNATTPANVVLSTSSRAAAITKAGQATLKNFKITTSGGEGINNQGYLDFSGIEFGTIATVGVLTQNGGITNITGNYRISGGSQRHMWVKDFSMLVGNAITVTLTGTPAFSSYFIQASGSKANLTSMTYSGSATGTRYRSENYSEIYTNGCSASYFPGNSNGSTSNALCD